MQFKPTANIIGMLPYLSRLSLWACVLVYSPMTRRQPGRSASILARCRHAAAESARRESAVSALSSHALSSRPIAKGASAVPR